MARVFFTASVGLGLLAGIGCSVVTSSYGASVQGSGHVQSRDYDYKGFSRVDVSHAFKLELTAGTSEQVTIEADDNLLDRLDIHQSGDELYLGLKPGTTVRQATLRARVTTPQLTALKASGATSVHLTGFQSALPFRLEVSGAAHVEGDIKTGDTEMKISGASEVNLKGGAGKMKLEASGASHAKLADYRAGDALVHASGASSAEVTADGALEAEASGASSVHYGGSPRRVRESASGASSIRRR